MAVQLKDGVPLIACGKVAIDPACCPCPACNDCHCTGFTVYPPTPPGKTYLHIKVAYDYPAGTCADCGLLANWFALTFKECGDGTVVNAVWEYLFPPGSPCGAEYLRAYVGAYYGIYDIRLGGTTAGVPWEIKTVYYHSMACMSSPESCPNLPTRTVTGSPPCAGPWPYFGGTLQLYYD